MFRISLLAVVLSASTLFALPMKSAMDWTCAGTELTTGTPVQFNLVLADHNGREYTYQALEEVRFGTEAAGDIDLTKTTVSCGDDDNGIQRWGTQSWNLNGSSFTFTSGCENETTEIEAICRVR